MKISSYWPVPSLTRAGLTLGRLHGLWVTHGPHHNPWVFCGFPWVFMGHGLPMNPTMTHGFFCGDPYPIVWVWGTHGYGGGVAKLTPWVPHATHYPVQGFGECVRFCARLPFCCL